MADPGNCLQPKTVKIIKEQAEKSNSNINTAYKIIGDFDTEFIIQVIIGSQCYTLSTVVEEKPKTYKHLHTAVAYIVDEFNAKEITINIK